MNWCDLNFEFEHLGRTFILSLLLSFCSFQALVSFIISVVFGVLIFYEIALLVRYIFCIKCTKDLICDNYILHFALLYLIYLLIYSDEVRI